MLYAFNYLILQHYPLLQKPVRKPCISVKQAVFPRICTSNRSVLLGCRHQGVVGDVLRDNGARADEGAAADGVAADDRAVGPQGGAVAESGMSIGSLISQV